MVNITIDNMKLSVPKGTSILNAAKEVCVEIPTLCFLKDINEIGACRACVVEIEGLDRMVTSCNNTVEEGMVIKTNSKKVRRSRKTTVEMLLSAHDCNCATCERSGNCKLQTLANNLHILEIPYEKNIERKPWNQDFPLIRDSSKCIKCMRCIQICDKVQGLNVWDLVGTGSRATVGVYGNKKIEDADCSLCGQCITHCPVGALRARNDSEKVWREIEDPNKVVVVQIAPAIRTAWGEAFGLNAQEATIGKAVDALRRLGVDHVFDTSFSADLTIMEEANEFVHRFTSGDLKKYPMFTSCCPAWVRFIESQYPDMLPQLSTAKSPQQMFGSVMKTYYANYLGIDPKDMVTVSIMPCVAKKDEATMEFEFEGVQGHETDYALTNREFIRMIKSANINPSSLKESECDNLMHDYTGAGVIFGTVGGVMEAALRTAYNIITGENADADAFNVVRRKTANEAVTEAEFEINGIKVRTAVVSGLGEVRKLVEAIRNGEVSYDFVEAMACPGGCVGGGGQPINDGEEMAYLRGKTLYYLDSHAPIRYSHENKDVEKLYKDYLGKPIGERSHHLLHREY